MVVAGHSVNYVAALARDASMSSSYKPALLKSLVRIVRKGCGEQITLERIGAEFVSLFWVQTVVFRLRQAATITSEPEVVRRIRYTSEDTGVRRLNELGAAARKRLDREMATVLKINVLDAFHRSKPLAMERLYEWSKVREYITMTESARSFVSNSAPSLEMLANLWWAKYLEKVNLLAPLVIQKVERDGATRSSLHRYLQILSRIDGPHCFYCGTVLSAARGAIHVDHVIPWSFLLADPLWDLVLACAPCNVSKSDSLPDLRYLPELAKVNARRSSATLPPSYASPLINETEIIRYFDAALSVEWPSGWAPTGSPGQTVPEHK